MNWEVKPNEYRYILGDFVRSGIHIKYEKVTLEGKPSIIHIEGKDIITHPDCQTIYFPYITGRQYQVYKEYHFVSSENDSWEYRILNEAEAGDFEDYDIEDFKNWQFFYEAFEISPENDSIFHNETNYCYAFIYNYQVRFLDLPLKSTSIIGYDMFNEKEFLEDLKFIGLCIDDNKILYHEDNLHCNAEQEDIQKNHIFEIYENYTKQQPFYPINMSLEWFYIVNGQRLSIDTILKSIMPINIINQDDFITNYIIDSFPFMSEEEIITTFKSIRDRYANKNKTRKEEWYIHTAALMNKILKINGIEHIAKKIRKVRTFCNNQGIDLTEASTNNVPHLKNVLSKYKHNIEKVYQILVRNNYLDEQTRLSDFKFYLTGELETNIQGKIYWKKKTIEMVDFISCISGDNGEWESVSKIFIDKEGKIPQSSVLKSTNNRSVRKYYDFFKELLK